MTGVVPWEHGGCRSLKGEPMTDDVTIAGTRPRKGERMTPGKGWRLIPLKGSTRAFAGTLLGTFYVDGKRVAMFRVPA